MLCWKDSSQHQRKSCETATLYTAASEEASRPQCHDQGVAAAPLLLAALQASSSPSTSQSSEGRLLWGPALNPAIKLTWVKGKTHRKEEGKALGGKGNQHHDAVQSKGWQAG